MIGAKTTEHRRGRRRRRPHDERAIVLEGSRARRHRRHPGRSARRQEVVGSLLRPQGGVARPRSRVGDRGPVLADDRILRRHGSAAERSQGEVDPARARRAPRSDRPRGRPRDRRSPFSNSRKSASRDGPVREIGERDPIVALERLPERVSFALARHARRHPQGEDGERRSEREARRRSSTARLSTSSLDRASVLRGLAPDPTDLLGNGREPLAHERHVRQRVDGITRAADRLSRVLQSLADGAEPFDERADGDPENDPRDRPEQRRGGRSPRSIAAGDATRSTRSSVETFPARRQGQTHPGR